jgi:outer membrane protein OmpA-like peptidoglycan-associated protein
MADNMASSANALSLAQSDADQSRLAAQQAQQAAQQSEADKVAMRTRLSEQLNSILQTRDSARGLIVSMSDVLFDTGKYSLKPGAREKLAKVAGILLAYPGLNIAVGGYTDNVGGRRNEPKTVREPRWLGARLLSPTGRSDQFPYLERLRQHFAGSL